MDRYYVKFYSPDDLASAYNLELAEKMLNNFDTNKPIEDINDILELYNIYLYIVEHEMRLAKWNDEIFEAYQEKCVQLKKIVAVFFSKINNDNFAAILENIKYDHDTFWNLFCIFNTYKKINWKNILTMIESGKLRYERIATHRALINFYCDDCAEYMRTHSDCASLLISEFLAQKDIHRPTYYYFPKTLSSDDKKCILTEYIESEAPHHNLLELIARSQNSPELPIDDRLRLKAKRKAEEFVKKFFETNVSMSQSISVSIVQNIDTEKSVTFKDGCLSATYSLNWLEEYIDFATILNNFIYIFDYFDERLRWQIASKKSNLGIFEDLFILKGQKDYPRGVVFDNFMTKSKAEMHLYYNLLLNKNIDIEDVFKWFFEEYLPNEFGVYGFSYNAPSKGTTYLEKCKLIALKIDEVLKQFKLFSEDGFIDRELLEISSSHMDFSSILSMQDYKFAYANSNTLENEKNFMMSSQSTLSFIHNKDFEYRYLADLLNHEKISKNDFEYYQIGKIEWLIERGAIIVDQDNILKLNYPRALILRELFEEEVIPIHYVPFLKDELEKLTNSGEMKLEKTLFSKPEQDYLNFVLNKSKFQNGYDLRNKYAHGTQSLNENQNYEDYLEFLKVMILIITRINEEFCLRDEQKKITQDDSDKTEITL